MIRDAKGRKWFLRFKQYREGWAWEAQCAGYRCGVEAGQCFPTKALAQADALRVIQSCDHIAQSQEYVRRLLMRGTPCQLTAEDHEAIARAAAS
jgi:hypothetical protein